MKINFPNGESFDTNDQTAWVSFLNGTRYTKNDQQDIPWRNVRPGEIVKINFSDSRERVFRFLNYTE